MPAYVLARIDVHDPEAFTREYLPAGSPTVEQYGGRYLAAGAPEVLEGDVPPGQVALLEFESAEQAQRWWNSSAYRAAVPLRQRSATSSWELLEGVVP